MNSKKVIKANINSIKLAARSLLNGKTIIIPIGIIIVLPFSRLLAANLIEFILALITFFEFIYDTNFCIF